MILLVVYIYFLLFNTMESGNVYVLLLQQNKFYIGYTARPIGARFLEHFDNNGAAWTKKYPAVQVLFYREGTKFDEDKLTLEYMSNYGWWNVRGGKWCRVDMKRCPNELLLLQGVALPRGLTTRNPQFTVSSDSLPRQIGSCFRCGRQGHFSSSCYAKTTVDGFGIYDNDDDDEDDYGYYNNYPRRYTNTIPVPTSQRRGRLPQGCFRCGRDSHFASECYARFHLDGDPL